jgi:hypothetical protein
VGRNWPGSLLVTRTHVQNYNNVFNLRLLCSQEHSLLMKESKQISFGSSDSTTAASDFKYSMQGKVISIMYLGAGSIHEAIERILRRIEYWHRVRLSPTGSFTRTLTDPAARSRGTERRQKLSPRGESSALIKARAEFERAQES